MTKKKVIAEQEEPLEVQEVKEIKPPKATHEIDVFVPYIAQSWKGAIDIFKCVECGLDSENEDDIILHCINHLPEAEREAAFELLVKE